MDSADRELDIENLARETGVPVTAVRDIYTNEHARLDRAAKIKTFLPVLLYRRVKELLVSRNSARIDFLRRSKVRLE